MLHLQLFLLRSLLPSVADSPMTAPPVVDSLYFVAGARAARGLTVVIDVFRAFSVAVSAFARGAKRIFPVAAIADAHALQAQLDRMAAIAYLRRIDVAPSGFDTNA